MIYGDHSPVMFQAPRSFQTDASRSRTLTAQFSPSVTAIQPTRTFVPPPPPEATPPKPPTRTEAQTLIPLPTPGFEEPPPPPPPTPRGETEQPGAPAPPSPFPPTPPTQPTTFQALAPQTDVAPAKESSLKPILIGGGVALGLGLIAWLFIRR